MALLILVGRRSVSHSPMPCDVVTWQSIKEWPKLGLGSSLAFWVVETVDGAITSTWLVVLSQKSIDALNSYGQLLFDKDITLTIVMPPPLGAGGIMFSGCPSVRPSVRPKPEIPSFDLYMGPLVHPTNRNRFTACPSVRLSVRPSVRPSVRRGFRAFAGERMEGMASNLTCWCILTVVRTD